MMAVGGLLFGPGTINLLNKVIDQEFGELCPSEPIIYLYGGKYV